MSLYEARLQADLEAIGRRVDAVGALVARNLHEALEGLLTDDRLRSYRVGLADKAINRETRAIDALCHEFVARHFPAAGHLRFVSSVLRLDVALERIGDYAVNIARRAVQLEQKPSDANLRVIGAVGGTAIGLLEEALAAWTARDAEAARTLGHRSRSFTKAHERTIDDLLVTTSATEMETVFVLRDVLFNFIRVGAQARNVGEETVFTVAGETKEPKVYEVLFVGEGNDGLTQLAESLARKAFPKSGRYHSVGWAPAEGLPDELCAAAQGAGLDLSGATPSPLDAELATLERYHVLVALEPGALDHLGPLPYSTVFLQWDIADGDMAVQLRELSSHVRDLMQALRGPDAA
jgi:phosphate transport system protein